MQTIGFVKIDQEKILVLIRDGKSYNLSRHLKLRKTGKDGVFMVDESNYLNDNPEIVKRLKAGEVIEC